MAALVGFRRFPLVLVDMPCYNPKHIEQAKRVVPIVYSESRMTMQQERWLSVDEIAAHMGVNPDTVYKWTERRKIPTHKMGRLRNFKATEVDEWGRQGKATEERDARLMKEIGINSRLQKGGALLSDMRRLVVAWSDRYAVEDPSAFVMKTLGKPSLVRARDTFIRAFRPRFLDGNPLQAWTLARALEDGGAGPETIKAFYFWITARTEQALYLYVTDELMVASASAHRQIRVEDAALWLRDRLRTAGKEWSPIVTRKVARGMLAALRDFGVLQGANAKTIAPRHCPLEAFALIAFCLNELGASGRALLEHPDWHLFLFDTGDVERAMLECDQKGWLGFQAAGAICRIDFPSTAFKEYVHVVLGR